MLDFEGRKLVLYILARISLIGRFRILVGTKLRVVGLDVFPFILELLLGEVKFYLEIVVFSRQAACGLRKLVLGLLQLLPDVRTWVLVLFGASDSYSIIEFFLGCSVSLNLFLELVPDVSAALGLLLALEIIV